MVRYSLEWFDKHIDSMIDKLGSDYFPLQIKLERFETMVYDFIRETTDYFEATQELSDDLKTLLVEGIFDVEKESLSFGNNIWNLPEPADYLRLVSVIPVIHDSVTGKDMVKAKKVNILKKGQGIAYERDPFRSASAEYPNVYRMTNFFKIDVGTDQTIYNKAYISYVKKPTIANMGELTKRIVNLNDIAIEKICLKTADSLRITTGDVNAAPNYQFNSSFGKK